jgi:hypothetical protein
VDAADEGAFATADHPHSEFASHRHMLDDRFHKRLIENVRVSNARGSNVTQFTLSRLLFDRRVHYSGQNVEPIPIFATP